MTYYAASMIRRHPSNPAYAEQVIAYIEELQEAMNPNMINITADPREPVPVTLVGMEYSIKPPKAALALKLAVRAKAAENDPGSMMEAVDQWIAIAFGKVGSKKIQARLESDEDDLDFPHIMQLMEALVEQTTGNPTSSS